MSTQRKYDGPAPSSLGLDGKVINSRTPEGLRRKNARLRAHKHGLREHQLRVALREIARFTDPDDIKKKLSRKFKISPRTALVVLNRAWARIQTALGDDWLADVARLRLTTQKLIQELLAEGDSAGAIKLLKMEADRLGQGGNNGANVVMNNIVNMTADRPEGLYTREEMMQMSDDQLRILASGKPLPVGMTAPKQLPRVIDATATSRPAPPKESQ